MTHEEIKLAVVIGLASALIIVALGVLDVLTVALFCGVLFAGGVLSAIRTADFGGTHVFLRVFGNVKYQMELPRPEAEPPPEEKGQSEPEEAEPAPEEEPPPTAAV